jgi:mannose-6-phosphate isomerase
VTQRPSHPVVRLEGSIRPYAWGSHTTIAELQGRSHPSSGPEAELWFGAHPSGPSEVIANEARWRLDEMIATAPEAILGPGVVERFGVNLPFLLKVLAIERPLSLQAHPSASQAVAGFRDEQDRGVPVDAPERTYRDAWPKPELLCALSEVVALAGFRHPGQTASLLDELAVPELGWLRDDLDARGDAALPGAIERLLRWPAETRGDLATSVVACAGVVAGAGGPHAEVARWLTVLGAAYPADPGVAVAALLNLVRLQPGEALYLPAGNLHAYLHGTAVELMAASDNVLRGGLTVKHVDVEGLLDVLTPTSVPTPSVSPVPIAGGHRYPTPSEHFALERLVPGTDGMDLQRRGPEILLAVGGGAGVVADGVTVALRSGQAAFVPADSRRVRLYGDGPVFRATVGTLEPR